MTNRRFLFLSLLCAALSMATLVPGLGGGFIFDDRPNIETNGALHVNELTGEALLYAAYSFQPGGGSRALAMVSFALDYWRAGLDPQAFKVTNLIIHGTTTVGLVFFVRLALIMSGWSRRRSCAVALVVALAWGAHPLQVSSVLYVVQRMQTLATLFLMPALLFYLKARQAQISGIRSRPFWLLSGFFWCLALASKEDAALFPAYTLALELTILRFRSAHVAGSRFLRRAYTLLAVTGLILFMFVVVPHYWQWGTYPNKDYSSLERLLTQGRVLVMYLGQIVLPMPSHLPFYYDDLIPSRGLLQPLTTLPALVLLGALITLAWRWRLQRPVFSFGIMLFFSGHFIASNVIGLELAFEHRNHLPMIGVLLALGDVLSAVLDRLPGLRGLVVGCVAAATIGLGVTTVARAEVWGNPLRFAQNNVAIAPDSVRARLVLCTTYFNMSGSESDSPYLDLAIRSCEDGAYLSDAATLLSNVVIFKSIQGTVTDGDWDRFLARLRTAPMTVQNKDLIWVMMNNIARQVPVDKERVIDAIEIVSRRVNLRPTESVRLAYFFLEQTGQPEKAYAYLEQAVQSAAVDDPLVPELLYDLKSRGRLDWVEHLAAMRASSHGKDSN